MDPASVTYNTLPLLMLKLDNHKRWCSRQSSQERQGGHCQAVPWRLACNDKCPYSKLGPALCGFMQLHFHSGNLDDRLEVEQDLMAELQFKARSKTDVLVALPCGAYLEYCQGHIRKGTFQLGGLSLCQSPVKGIHRDLQGGDFWTTSHISGGLGK